MAVKVKAADETKLRISFTIDPETRRLIRIASAHADLEPGEWAVAVIKEAAVRQVKEGRSRNG